MIQKRTCVFVAVLLANLALLPLVLGAPEGRAQGPDKGFFFHCCKQTASGRRYCCKKCCVMTWNCTRHEMCKLGRDGPKPKLADSGTSGNRQ